jgi:hypothetical protein
VRATLLLGCLLACSARTAAAAPPAAAGVRLYTLAIGNNEPPTGAAGAGLQPLQYADDDAAAFHSFTASLAAEATLLTVLDRRSQERFPGLVGRSQPPTVRALRRAIAHLAARIRSDQARGQDADVLLFFSGHGLDPSTSQPGLVLLDGLLDRRFLYEEILAVLPARHVHVVIDACHAEAVVQVRDAGGEREATTVAVSDEEARRWVGSTGLRRYPHAGAVIATSASQQAHEWAGYEHGVFSHIVLSGLRGAADVNHDRRIEYSELHAFLGAATGGVRHPGGRPSAFVHPPARDARAALLDLQGARNLAWVRDLDARLGHFFIEDARGQRLMDGHAEPGYRLQVAIPAGVSLFLRSGERELELRAAAGSELRVTPAALRLRSQRPRGAIAASYRTGLFQRAYGPHYYAGFVDQTGALPVEFASPGLRRPAAPPAAPRRRLAPYLLWTGAAVAAIGTGTFAALALDARGDYLGTDLQRPAHDARDRFTLARTGVIVSASATAVLAGAALWLTLRPESSTATTGPPALVLAPLPGVGGAASWHLSW